LLIDEVQAGSLTRPAAAHAIHMALDEFLVEAGQHGLFGIDYDIDVSRRELAAISETGA
jgi:hypothetical protein